jgi:hypothetical protein
MYPADRISQLIFKNEESNRQSSGAEQQRSTSHHVARRTHAQICADILDVEVIKSLLKESCPCVDSRLPSCFGSFSFGNICDIRNSRAHQSPDNEGFQRRELLQHSVIMGADGKPRVPLLGHLVCLHAYISICAFNASTGQSLVFAGAFDMKTHRHL